MASNTSQAILPTSSEKSAEERNVLNTASICIDDQWQLTTLHNLRSAKLLDDNEIIWMHEDDRYLTYVDQAIDRSHAARASLDALSSLEKSILNDLEDFKHFSTFIGEWVVYYNDLSGVVSSQVSEIILLTYDGRGRPWERGESSKNSKIRLVSGELYDLPLRDFTVNIRSADHERGETYAVFKTLCWVEITTMIFNEIVDVAGIKSVLSKDRNTVLSHVCAVPLLSLALINFGKEDSQFPRDTQEEVFQTYREYMDILGFDLQELEISQPSLHSQSLAPRSPFLSRLRTHRSRETSVLPASQDSQNPVFMGFVASGKAIPRICNPKDFLKFVSLLNGGILVTMKAGSLSLGLLVIERAVNWSSIDFPQGESKGAFTYAVSKKNALEMLRFQGTSDWVHMERTVLPLLRKVVVHPDGARGPRQPIYMYIAWLYVFFVIVIAIIVVSLNVARKDSIWERLFSGIEFLTFALVGVFGLVKLSAEDENAIRNTFLGYVKLRTEEDVARYIGTKNLPLAVACYDGDLHWAHEAYACYATGKSSGNIRILAGLDKDSARIAGLIPIGKNYVVDFRTTELKGVSDAGNGFLHIGSPVKADFLPSDFDYTDLMTTERFRGT